MNPVRSLVLVILAAVSATACDGGTEPRVPGPWEVTTIRVVRGAGQQGRPGETLPDSVAIEALTEDGLPVPEVRVDWFVHHREKPEVLGCVNGGFGERTVTDRRGRSSVVVTLGPEVGEYTLQADPITNLPVPTVFASFEAVADGVGQ
ncbi:MAG TPA: hypothetical protein VF188_09390 [Longimicrobiales bacterium]